MSLYIASLNSGSNGNSYYIGNDQEAVLVDAGLSCRETEKRMRRLGLSLSLVKGIFISHEHDDHIRGVEVLSKRYQLPVYITANTQTGGRMPLEGHLIRSFRSYEPVIIGRLQITGFPKQHDASDPHSFIVTSSSDPAPAASNSGILVQPGAPAPIRIGIFTDLGIVCENLVHHFRQCHAAFLEANYDEEMLEKGRYPWPLKNRIRGGQGHLSNRQALELFLQHRPPFMTHLLLAHLSKDNNCPELVQSLFDVHAGTTRIIVASRYEETEVYRVEGGNIDAQWETASPTPPGTTDPQPTDALPTAPIPASTLRRRRKALAATMTTANPASIQGSLF